MKKADLEKIQCPRCNEIYTLGEAKGLNVPTPETKDKQFQMDKFGNFRIVVNGIESPWTSQYDIAGVEHEGTKFFAVHPSGPLSRTFPGGTILNVPIAEQVTPVMKTDLEEPPITEVSIPEGNQPVHSEEDAVSAET